MYNYNICYMYNFMLHTTKRSSTSAVVGRRVISDRKVVVAVTCHIQVAPFIPIPARLWLHVQANRTNASRKK